MEPKICIDCYKRIVEGGYRIEKRGGHPSWMPTKEQEKFIRDNWDKLFIVDIAAHCGVKHGVITQYSKRVSLPVKYVSYKRYHAEWVKMYQDEKYAITDICDKYNVSRITLRHALQRNGVKIRSPGEWSTRKK